MKRKGAKWTKTGAENLVRHRSGKYYLRAKVRGKKVRHSLETSDLKIAKIRRDDQLRIMRAAETADPDEVRTIGHALALLKSRTVERPELKARSKQYYRQAFARLEKTLPLGLPGRAWTRDMARQWWADYAADRSPQQANNALHLVRKLAEMLRESGVRVDDPTRGLKRVPLPSRPIGGMPTREDLGRILDQVRKRGLRGEGSANMIEFLAWSGLRIAELRALLWEDIDADWLTVTGGEDGTKNRRPRRVPICGPLREVIARMRYEGAGGPVFLMGSPRAALRNACKALRLSHLRVHDLRHLFATQCIESGIDIPTLAKWLGHQDGGVLAMRTYGHIRDDHSLQEVRKLG